MKQEHKISRRVVCVCSAPVVAVVVAGFLFAGCASAPPITNLSDAYVAGLAASARVEPLAPGGLAEQRGIRSVTNLFTNYSTRSIEDYAAEAYAETLYFRDGFKELSNRADIVTYLLHGAEPLRACTFRFDQVTRDGRDYYFRWVMTMALQSDPSGHADEAVGMSHIRFNAEGQVMFQQDYWDPTDVLYRRIPIARGLIGWVKSKL
ncbi:MAG: hypothetical protein ACI9OU_000337 [Candidatus Promineifilaceae bacterium]|jgi:hypothetical protein